MNVVQTNQILIRPLKNKLIINEIINSEDNFRIKILFINLTFLLFIFRTAIPLFKYPFLLLFSGNVIYYLVFHRRTIVNELGRFARSFSLILIIIGVHILAFLLSDKIYLIVFKEVSNSLVLLSLFFMLSLSVSSTLTLERYLDDLLDLIILFGFVISVLGILDILDIFSINGKSDIDYNFALLPVYFSIIAVIYKKVKTDSLTRNAVYNFISIFYLVQIMFSGSRRGLIIGVILIVVLFCIQLYYLLNRRKLANSAVKKISKASFFISFSFILIPVVFYLFLFKTSYTFKENTLGFIGTRNNSVAKNKLSFSIFRYVSVLENRYNYTDFYDNMWPSLFDPKYPNTWDKGVCKSIISLTGENVNIVPEGSIGLKIDSTCISIEKDSIYSNEFVHNIKVKNGDIVEASVYCYVSKNFNGKQPLISIKTKGFDDESSNEYKYYQPEETKSKVNNLLENGDFKDGTLNWMAHAVSTKHQIIDTPFGKGVRISRTVGEGDWSLQYIGRPVIYYAGHEYSFHFYYKVIKGNPVPFNIGWWLNDGGQGIQATVGLPLEIKNLSNGWREVKCSYRFKETHSSVYTFLNSLSSGSIVDLADIKLFDLDHNESCPPFAGSDKGWWQKLKIISKGKNGNICISLRILKEIAKETGPLQGFVIFAHPEFRIIKSDEMPISDISFNSSRNTRSVDIKDYYSKTYNAGFLNFHLRKPEFVYQDTLEKDIVRRFFSGLISQDTCYHGYNSAISVDTISNSFTDMRLRRWQFAIQIYLKEYGIFRKIFGGGFNHLNWFGYYFDKDKTASDYPHNPIFSVLLYSGILGLSLYLLLLFRTIRYYSLYFKKFYILFLFLLITFFFSFFSSGNPLDPPVMGFLIIMATFIHNVYSKQQNS